VNNSSFAATALTLVVLIAVAGWQFHALASGRPSTSSYSADRSSKSWPGESTARPTLAVSGP
jgi:hypothetical protein